MSQQSSSKKAKGCVKLRRCQKHKSYYQVQAYQTDKNREKRMLRHLRSNPGDIRMAARYGLDEITFASLESTSKGRKLKARYRALGPPRKHAVAESHQETGGEGSSLLQSGTET
jgi:hypothetical protein